MDWLRRSGPEMRKTSFIAYTPPSAWVFSLFVFLALLAIVEFSCKVLYERGYRFHSRTLTTYWIDPRFLGPSHVETVEIQKDLLEKNYAFLPLVEPRSTLTSPITKPREHQGALTSYDGFARRFTPMTGEASQKANYMLFAGCSFTLGQGVHDKETIPYFFEREFPKFRAYIYGAPGSSPGETLVRLQAIDPETEIQEKSGYVVFTIIDDHFRRQHGMMSMIGAWTASHPYFNLDDQGRLVQRGSFKTEFPFRTLVFWVLRRLNFFRFFQIDFPITKIESIDLLIVKILQEMKHLSLNELRALDLIVVIYPWSKNALRLKPLLEAQGITVVDFFNNSDFDPANRKQLSLTDGHPNAKANELYAVHLAHALKQKQVPPNVAKMNDEVIKNLRPN